MISGSVLDASALLAYLLDEPGRDVVAYAIAVGAVMSVVNWAEVLSKFKQRGEEPQDVVANFRRQPFLRNGVQFRSMTRADCLTVAELWPWQRAYNLSLADRACLALGLRLERPVVHAEQRWQSLEVGVPLQLIR